MSVELVLLIVVVLAGLYMAWNIGANDVANAIGTSVGSGALTLRQAVIIAAILEFCGAYFFGSHVTDMMQSGIVNPSIFTFHPYTFVLGMLSSLIAAGVWLQIASYFGWPVSTTHSIVGAIVGFGAAIGGMEAVYWGNVFYIASAWIFSPIMGAFIAYLIFNTLRKKIFYAPCPVSATKRLTPKIVFAFLSTLSIIILYGGLKNIDFHLELHEAIGLSLLIGLVGMGISYLCVQRIKTPDSELQRAPEYSPEAVLSLQKVQKHLRNVRKETTGEMADRIDMLMDQVNQVSAASQARDMIGSSDYASVERVFSYLQIMSACLMTFSHGANDVANAIGPMSAAIQILLHGVEGVNNDLIPTWTLALGGCGIVIGLATWGWRVIETIGKKITELTPTRGFSAEFGAAITIVLASRLGLPISTTHTIVGAVLGVGMARGIEALNLDTTRDIVISWIVTVPAGAGVSIGCFYLLEMVFT